MKRAIMIMVGALCAIGIGACADEDKGGPVAPSPVTGVSEAATTSAAHVAPDVTADAGNSGDRAQSLGTDASWQPTGGAQGRNGLKTKTSWLSASPSLLTPGDEVTVRFARSGHKAQTENRGATDRNGPWVGEYYPKGYGSLLSLKHSSSTDPAVFTGSDPRGREGCNNAGNRRASTITICTFKVPEDACELSEWPGYPQFTRAICRAVKVVLSTTTGNSPSTTEFYRHVACVQTEASFMSDGVEYSAVSGNRC